MFVIRSYPRCGSNMLASALGNHTDIKNHGELFHVAHNGHSLKRHGAAGWLLKQEMAPYDCFVVHAVVPGNERVRQVYEELWTGIKAYQPPVILLEREDIIRRYASLQIATKTNNWRRDHEIVPVTSATVELDPNDAVTNYLQTKQAFEEGRSEFPWGYVVTYEQLLHRWERHMQKIQTMLGLPIQQCVPKTLKQDARPIQEIVSNYDEFKAALIDRPAWGELFEIAEAGVGRNSV